MFLKYFLNMLKQNFKKERFLQKCYTYHFSVHVRRTDKINLEAAFHSLDEYMKHVKEYYDQLQRTQNVTRRVYLATDDPSVLSEAKKK